jgi:large subunit ribosomal protein L30
MSEGTKKSSAHKSPAHKGSAHKGGAHKGGAHGAPHGAKLVTITLTRSVHGQLKNIAASVRGLGLRRPHQSVTIADTAENRGMMHAAGHLLKVEQN